MSHIMLDLETWGLRPGSALRSIGACVFTLPGEIGQQFYANIDKQSCLDVGLTIDPSTEKWWAEQDAKAQEALLDNPQPLSKVTEAFYVWFVANNGEQVWSQGSNFDGVLWEVATKRAPWKFFNTRDTRTAYELAGLDSRSVPRAGTHHNALEDAIHQARCVQAAYARIKEGLK